MMNPEADPFTLDASEVAPETIAPLALELGSLQDVEVKTEALEGRKRQISASIQIPHPMEKIWTILTDYDGLANFIPSLAHSCRLQESGDTVRIEQVGTESMLKIKFRARVVLDMIEKFPHQIDFCMVEGDFKEFFGYWQLSPLSKAASDTLLRYTVTILPPRAMPVALIERRLKGGLVLNLTAIRQRADELFGKS